MKGKRTMGSDEMGWFSDDITFCPKECEIVSCMRNKANIRNKSIPHSFSVEIPSDCPLTWKVEQNDQTGSH